MRGWIHTTGSQQTPARSRAQERRATSVAGRTADRWISPAPVSGWSDPRVAVKRKTAITGARGAANNDRRRLSVRQQKEDAMPSPVPNSTVALRMCTSLRGELVGSVIARR